METEKTTKLSAGETEKTDEEHFDAKSSVPLDAKDGNSRNQEKKSSSGPLVTISRQTRRKRGKEFCILLEKNLKITVRERCNCACSFIIPLITLIFIWLIVYLTKVKKISAVYVTPYHLEELPAFDYTKLEVTFPKDNFIKKRGVNTQKWNHWKFIMNIDPVLRRMVAQGWWSVLKKSKDISDVKNLMRFKLAFTPKTKTTIRIMKAMQRHLNFLKVIDFQSEMEMIDAINKDHQLDVSLGIKSAVKSRLDKFLCGIVFEDGNFAEKNGDIHIKIRFPYDSPEITYIQNWFRDDIEYWRTDIFFKKQVSEVQYLEPADISGVGGNPRYYSKGFLAVQWVLAKYALQEVKKNPEIPLLGIKQLPFPGFGLPRATETILLLFDFMMIIMPLYIILEATSKEKESGMKELLAIFGVSPCIQRGAWFIHHLLVILFPFVCSLINYAILLPGQVEFGLSFLFIISFYLAGISTARIFSVTTNTTRSGTIVLLVHWYISTIASQSFFKPDTDLWIVLMFSLISSHLAGAMGLIVLNSYMQTKTVLTASLINTPATETSTFTLLHIILMLMLDAVLYYLISIYIEEMNPGIFGVRKSPCFCFKSCRKKRIKKKVSWIKLIDNYEFNEKDKEKKIRVALRNVSKEYGSLRCGKTTHRVAVDNISLDLYEDELFVLLGHNGAGKSTTMNMTCGFIQQTSGHIWVNGVNTLEDLSKIRKEVSFCPQINVLFDNLNIEEHIRFFGTLMGSTKEDLKWEIENLLIDLKMQEKRKTYAKNLSGGTKRKTCLAMALVGNASFTILDEPTSGIDVTARHIIWEVIEKSKPGRTILLSTHFMDEAEALGDRIAIMSDGIIICCGSSIFLKKRFGLGYQLLVVKGPKCDTEQLQKTVVSYISNAEIERNIPGEISFVFPSTNKASFPGLFQYLDDNKEKLGIISYGASMDKLEEAYIRAIGLNTAKNQKFMSKEMETDKKEGQVEDTSSITSIQDIFSEDIENVGGKLQKFHKKSPIDGNKSKYSLGCITLSNNQLQALFKKRAIVSLRQVQIIILGVILPVFIALLQLINWSLLRREPLSLPALKLIPTEIPQNAVVLFRNSYKANDLLFHSCLKLEKEVLNSRFQLKNIIRVSSNQRRFQNKTNWKYDYKNFNKLEQAFLSNNADNFKSYKKIRFGFLFSSIKKVCSLNRRKHKNIQTKRPIPANVEHLCNLFYALNPQASKSDLSKKFPPFIGITNKNLESETITAYFSEFSIHSSAISLLQAINTIYRYNLKTNAKRLIQIENAPIEATEIEKQKVNYDEYKNGLTVDVLITSYLVITPFFIHFIILERITGAKHVQVLSGLWITYYWFVTFVWDILFYHLSVLLLILLVVAFNYTTLLNAGLDKVYVISLLFGMSQLPFVYIFSFAFKDAVFGVFIMLLINILGMFVPPMIMILINLITENKDFLDGVGQFFELLLSPYALSIAFSNLNENGAKKQSCAFQVIKAKDVSASILKNPVHIGEFFYDSIFWGGTTFSIDQAINYYGNTKAFYFADRLTIQDVADEESGYDAVCKVYKSVGKKSFLGNPIVRHCCKIEMVDYYAWKPPGIGRQLFFFFIQMMIYTNILLIIEWSMLCCNRGRTRVKKIIISDEDDDDVTAENLLVNKYITDQRLLEGGATDPHLGMTLLREGRPALVISHDDLIVHNLGKSFGNFKAVDGISFVVPKGQLFGLLGLNGAGKSTTFKMLSGEIGITHGNVWLTIKKNIYKNLRDIQHQMGYCPQTDPLIEKLTGTEMLELFAMLRGIPKKEVPKVIKEISDLLLLTDHMNRRCGTYSGGNKRKLSLALALIGKPPLVMLDEPTTGVDPVARRRMWDAILTVRENKDQSVVLTSHLMEECDVLCNRICIMVKGRMRCVGLPQYLKSKFTIGYTATVVFNTQNAVSEENFLAVLQKDFPDAEIKERGKTATIYRIPNGPNRSWASVFGFFEKNAKGSDVDDYDISQTTLDEVFIQLTADTDGINKDSTV